VNGVLQFEISCYESSIDYYTIVGDTNGAAGFYSHSHITQGLTNRGQWLGAGIGQGGNSQYMGYTLYFPRGSAGMFIQRQNPDLDYTFTIDRFVNIYDWFLTAYNIRAFVDFGFQGQYFINKHLAASIDFVFRNELNPLNVSKYKYGTVSGSHAADANHRYNCYIGFGLKWLF
jgi:hypothetical protein